jgi:hypothetical protein
VRATLIHVRMKNLDNYRNGDFLRYVAPTSFAHALVLTGLC